MSKYVKISSEDFKAIKDFIEKLDGEFIMNSSACCIGGSLKNYFEYLFITIKELADKKEDIEPTLRGAFKESLTNRESN